ncbi:hypothetical protein KDA_28770 [Dictyobacter alpinus]|uniref:N-acetyltransferase domain-containing protein n=1 Tax=Dictyobacter alpinus TaxID=2014873 RepID=A0A402B7L6_9CHLR|nr:GNAT family N-acetyltransferase [Dictyobacter alpinus]GCE27393.1 hypothetical protein KDA_28770 [Dictyobacter alpinus]
MKMFSARELLRLHLEAVWGISLPDLTMAHHDVAATGLQPPWHLYSAQMDSDTLFIWRADVLAQTRVDLQQHLAHSPGYKKQAEIALVQTEPSVMDLQRASSLARPLTRDDYPLMESSEAGWGDYFLQEHVAPVFGVVEDHRVVSIAHSSRRTKQACELGVETLPQARHRGFALAVTLLWANAIKQEGLIPFYSAMAENSSSLKLAHSAGYRPFVEGTTITPIQETRV